MVVSYSNSTCIRSDTSILVFLVRTSRGKTIELLMKKFFESIGNIAASVERGECFIIARGESVVIIPCRAHRVECFLKAHSGRSKLTLGGGICNNGRSRRF